MRQVLVSRTGPKFDSTYVITDISHYARQTVLTFNLDGFLYGNLMDREYNAKEMGWERKPLDCNLILLSQSKRVGSLSFVLFCTAQELFQ